MAWSRESRRVCLGDVLQIKNFIERSRVQLLNRRSEERDISIDNGKVTALTTWYGISGTALSWFTSYLTDRRQAIKIGNCFSNMLPTSCGVPQGSVLGPLFTLYTTPLSSVIQSHNLDHHLYADDTQICVSLTTPDTCRSLNQLRDCLQG